MVLLKENHLTAAGGVSRAMESVHRRQRNARRPLRVEVEVRNVAETSEALLCGADRVMLDNMPLPDLAQVVALRDLVNPACEIEASGNITVELVRDVAATGVDSISLGSLTHSAPALDLSVLVTTSTG
jgi:nicotinate-nucleotide pyrophosphorylase (carboxylating)